MGEGDVQANLNAWHVSILRMGNSDGDTSDIQAHDPGFDQTNFLAWTEQAHFAIVTALNNGDVNSLKPYIADTLFPRLQAQAEHHASTPKGDPNGQHPTIVRAGSDASFDTIVVRLQEQHGAVDWTFQRSSKMQTTPGALKATEPGVCPVCGSPRQLDASGLCVYCKTPGPPPKFDWLLVQQETAPPDVAAIAARKAKRSGAGVLIFVVVIILLSVGVPVAIALLANNHHTTDFANANTSGGTTAASAPSGPLSLTVELTLSGADNLSPSSLDPNNLALNGGHFGDCPTAPLQAVGLDLTFDSGDRLTGTFTLPKGAPVGKTVDFATGGTAMLHQVGGSGDPMDDQTWALAPSMGTVTLKADSTGGGSLTWTNLPAGEANHSGNKPMSGTATWTCS